MTKHDLQIRHRTLQIEQHQPIKNHDKVMWSGGRVSRARFTSGIRRFTVKRHEHHLIYKSSWTPVCVNEYKQY